MSCYSSDQGNDAANISSANKASGNIYPATSQKTQGICKDVVHANVCVSAKVVIDPIVEVGSVRTSCLSRPEIIPCDGKCGSSGDSCCFIVRQRLCVEVPIAFGTSTAVDPLGIDCKGADNGPCKCTQ